MYLFTVLSVNVDRGLRFFQQTRLTGFHFLNAFNFPVGQNFDSTKMYFKLMDFDTVAAICSSRPVRSADRCDLLIPWSRTSLSRNRSVAVVGPALWKYPPLALRSVMLQGISSASLCSLKTFHFHQPVTLRAPLNSLL